MALAIVYCPLSSLIGILQGKYFSFEESLQLFKASQVVLLVKNPSGNSGDPRDSGPIPELGRSPGVGNGTLLQYSCLENSMGRGAWRATVHRVVELDTTERLSTQHRAHIPCQFYIFFTLFAIRGSFPLKAISVSASPTWELFQILKDCIQSLETFLP